MQREQGMSGLRTFWRLLLAIVAAVAVIQELRKPANKRTWTGMVGGFVPYDFRMPTWERVQKTYWNPDGPVLSGKAFGVGWAPNFGAVARLFGK
jgi:hypothetical protein